MDISDRHYMELALKLAELGKGFTSPNPMVGAVVVQKHRIVGVGYHKHYQAPHAEITALNNAKGNTCGATLFVNLEPHHFYGKNPPCTAKIIQARIKRVVVASQDPNPKVNGSGIKALKKAGIKVELGLLGAECRSLNETYFTFMEKYRPFIVLKLALSLDGFIADKNGHSKWISQENTREYIYKLRSEFDGIVTGIGTVLQDDPLLTTHVYRAHPKFRRFVLDSDLTIPLNAKILKVPPQTVIVTKKNQKLKIKNPKLKVLKKMGIEIWTCPNLKNFLTKVYSVGIQSLFFESGIKLSASLLQEDLWDKIHLFYSPKIMGEGQTPFKELGSFPIEQALTLGKVLEVKHLDKDFEVILKNTRR